MKKTYITTMPNHIGSFLKASECFAALGINITRVSYNKAIDSHTLFLDAEGAPEKLAEAEKYLTEIGYLQSAKDGKSIVLLEFKIKDVPGSVTAILSLINEFNFNISYISSQENGTDYQLFKLGLFVEDPEKIKNFLLRAEKEFSVRVINYNHSEKVYDNSIFYNSFVSGLVQSMGLSDEYKNDLLVNANLAMQILDEKGLSPYRTFDSIHRFANLLAACRGKSFSPRISHHTVTENTKIILIEPPCGSNTTIIVSNGEVLFVDSGYTLYHEEMTSIFRKLIPDYDNMTKRAFVTHADLDHCGMLTFFDEIYAIEKTAECLRLEYSENSGYREQNPLHRPYINMCKILTGHRLPDPSKLKVICGDLSPTDESLKQIGFFDFGELHFEVYEGGGAHVEGETVLIDYAHKIAFTGDIYINLKGLTSEQAEYNQYAPILMTSVDSDPKSCAMERTAILQRLGAGNWQIFGGHGFKKDYTVNIEL